MRRRVLVAGVLVAVVIGLPAAASAVVEITPNGPIADDGYLELAVAVPDVCDGGQTAFELGFPDGSGLTLADPAPVEGWTAQSVAAANSDRIERVTWSSPAPVDGDVVFGLSIAPVSHDVDTVEFTAVQTCADGVVVRWSDDQPGAEFPGPVLAVDHTGHEGGSHDHVASQGATASAPSSSDAGAWSFAVMGFGVLVAGGGWLALRRRRATRR